MGRKRSGKSVLPLNSSSRLARLIHGRLEPGLDMDPNDSFLLQSLSEHPELSTLEILGWEKQNELTGEISCPFLPVSGPEIPQREIFL